MAETVIVNGLDLNSPWCQIEDISQFMNPAGRRGDNVVVPGRHGVIRTPRKRYTAADLVLPVLVKGVDRATGIPPADAVTQLHDNLDVLLAALNTETILAQFVRPDDTVRQALLELMLEPVTVTRERSYPPAVRLSAGLSLLSAFWQDSGTVSQSVTGTTGTVQALTAFVGATASISELVLTFGPCNNPTLSHGDRFVTYNGVISAGRQLVINTANWTVSPGTGAAWAPDPRQVSFGPGPTWFELDPKLNPFQVTFAHTGGGSATCSISGKRTYLTP